MSIANSRLGRRAHGGAALVAALTVGLAAPRSGLAAGTRTPACPEASRTHAAEARIQAVVDSVLAARPDAHGIAVRVDAPRICIAHTFVAGLADPATSAPLTPQTPVRMASNTKTYVAAATLRLIEDGRLGLDDPISSRLSAEAVAAIKAGGYDASAITVRHLLSHSSGLFDYAMSAPFQAAVTASPTHRWTRLEQVRFAAEHGASYGAPGAVFHYSDTGYILLGEIIERVTRQPLAAALRSLIGFDRLGLTSTWLETLEPVPEGVPPRAHQFYGAADTYEWDPSLDLYGGGGLAATVGDMATFTRALMVGHVFKKSETLKLMTETGANEPRYRLGISVREDAGERGWGHSGFWNTWSFHYPAPDVTVAGAILQNGANGVGPVITRRVLEEVRSVGS